MNYAKDLQQILQTFVKERYGLEVETVIEKPAVEEHGDYATNLPLTLAKTFKKSPMEIAKDISADIKIPRYITKVVPAQPGFVNFFANTKVLAEQTLKAIVTNTLVTPVESKEKVIVEHTSVNPNKSMHVGHIRNAALGDAICNLLKRLGYKVEIHNYIDDTGVQVADTVNGILSLGLKQPKGQRFDDYCWDVYTKINEEYGKENQALLQKRKDILHAIENNKGEIAKKAEDIVEKIVYCHLDTLSSFNIYYDLLVYESDIIHFGFWEQAFEDLKESPNFVFETEGVNQGCWVLKYTSEKFGDKVFVRKDGTKVYTAKDTAYHLWKFGLLNKDFLYQNLKNFDANVVWKTYKEGIPKTGFGRGNMIINLIDERQTYPQEMVKHSLHTLGFTKAAANYHHVAYGVVSLSKETAEALGVETSDDKAVYAMSGRKGIGVKVNDLLSFLTKEVKKIQEESDVVKKDTNLANPEEIAAGAIKHYMLKSNPYTAITFDYQQALQLTGNTGPYLQYSHARAANILKKAGEFTPVYAKEEKLTKEESALAKELSNWPAVLNKAFDGFNISIIAEYAFNLSKNFHGFYEKNNVIKSKGNTRDFRLTLTQAYMSVIKDVLSTLGLTTPERM